MIKDHMASTMSKLSQLAFVKKTSVSAKCRGVVVFQYYFTQWERNHINAHSSSQCFCDFLTGTPNSLNAEDAVVLFDRFPRHI